MEASSTAAVVLATAEAKAKARKRAILAAAKSPWTRSELVARGQSK